MPSRIESDDKSGEGSKLDGSQGGGGGVTGKQKERKEPPKPKPEKRPRHFGVQGG